MKKILFFFTIFFIYGCVDIKNNSKETATIDCPAVYFSTENNTYIDGEEMDLSLDKVNYKASLNNYRFSNECNSYENFNNFNLDLLIIIDPINPQIKNVNIPIFLLIYNFDNILIDKQFFRVESDINYNFETDEYLETEIVKKLNINVSKETQVGNIIIGFVKL